MRPHRPCPWPGLLEDLTAFVAHPTVSADPRRRAAMTEAARWLASHVRQAGFPEVTVVAAGGAPAVLGRWDQAPHLPTLLLYGHYDVVPAFRDPSWPADPFALRRAGARLVGRGTSDDKGFVLAQLEAVRRLARRRRDGGLPVNLRCLYEGEEEVGSPTLPAILEAHRRRLRADAAVVCDTEGADALRPSLTVSCRGGLTVDIEVRGPGRNLHSGRFGGVVRQPALVLAEVLATLHDSDGRLRLDGFYDRVRPARGGLRADRDVLAAAGVRAGWGEAGFGPAARVGIRPSASVTRLAAGCAGRGPQHVIPSRALAQVNFRLVADQDPDEIRRSLLRHLGRHGRGGDIGIRARVLAAARPWQADPRHRAFRQATASVVAATGMAPAIVRSGGSIPALGHLEDRGVVATSVVVGFAQPQDQAHGGGESVDPCRLALAASALARLVEDYGRWPW